MDQLGELAAFLAQVVQLVILEGSHMAALLEHHHRHQKVLDLQLLLRKHLRRAFVELEERLFDTQLKCNLFYI